MPLTIPPPRVSGYTATTTAPLYWARYGDPSAQSLLILHGGPGAHHDYLLPQMLTLAERFELVFYDQRGGGLSKTDDRAPITWQTQVADVAAVVRELALEPLTLVGYSWGGLLAMLYAEAATANPTLPPPRRLVLIDPAPITRDYRRRFEAELARRQGSVAIVALREELAASGLRERDPEAYRQRAFEISVAGYFADPGRARDLTPFRVLGRVQQSVWESLGDFDLRPRLAAVRVPTLVVHGVEDPIPQESSVDAAAALGGRFEPLAGSAHVPYVERPDLLFPLVQSFLDETGQTG
ncbi:MAG: proline iminopeptidase-family hydrolase [Gemmatimonadaceae bacterium]